MRIRVAVPDEHLDPHVINAALEAVTRLDESMIRSGASPTSDELVAKGAVWHPEPPGDEHFDNGATIAARGAGDCDDWAPLDAATRRLKGDTHARAIVIPSGPSTYHAVVQSGDGRVLLGREDISARAGMKPMSEDKARQWGGVVGCCGDYGGACLPTVGPLSLHAGPQMSVRGCATVSGTMYEGRCDMPLGGSPLLAARAARGFRAQGRRVHGGHVPYALSSTAHGFTPDEAMAHAILGAIHAADASEMVTHPDRYKLLAVHARMAGVQPAAVVHMLAEQVYADAYHEGAARGLPPAHLLGELARQLGTRADPAHIAAAIHQDIQSHGFRA
jgi:hypothetical protein